MRRSLLASFGVVGMELTACVASDHSTSIDRCVEQVIEIDRGAYGLTTTGCDTPDCTESVASGIRVAVYPPGGGVTTEAIGPSPIRYTTSNKYGVYQLALAAGTYDLCTYSCTPLIVHEAALTRVDWTSGIEGGYWNAAPCPPRD